MNNVSAIIAEYASAANQKSLPTCVTHDFKRALLDYMSCIISGSKEPIVSALASCLDSDKKSSSPSFDIYNNAFINGVRAHAIDFDDGYTQGSCHPGAVIFPAVFSIAKKYNSSTDEIIKAVVLGYDVMLRIAATVHPTSAKYGFHNTSIAGIFGAAAAAASIIGLDPKKMRNALGLAASFSGGILEFLEEGADSKRLHAGKAARDGVLCAEMAARGISGPNHFLEGNFGFFNAFTRNEIRSNFIIDSIGQKFLISDVYFKLYPCCRHYHAAIDAALDLKSEVNFQINEIKSIEIGLYEIAVKGHDQKIIKNLLEAQMSAPCAISLALLDNEVSNTSFSTSSLDRLDFQRTIEKTTTVIDPLCESIYPSVRSGVVTLTLTNGTQLQKRIDNPKGESSNPLSDTDLEKKFINNSKSIISNDKISEILEKIWNFDNKDPQEILKINNTLFI